MNSRRLLEKVSRACLFGLAAFLLDKSCLRHETALPLHRPVIVKLKRIMARK